MNMVVMSKSRALLGVRVAGPSKFLTL